MIKITAKPDNSLNIERGFRHFQKSILQALANTLNQKVTAPHHRKWVRPKKVHFE